VRQDGRGQVNSCKGVGKAKDAVLFVQDELLDALYPGQIQTIDEFAERSARLRDALSTHIVDLLTRGISVVLDFPGNTGAQRAWFRGLIQCAGVDHELHYIDAPNDVCKRQLKQRSDSLPAGHPWTTDAEFDAITVYFQPPLEEEGFNVVRNSRA